MQILVLPAGPAPKKLTARGTIHHLEEHLLAFRALHGFEEDEEPDGSPTMYSLLHDITGLDQITVYDLKAKSIEYREVFRKAGMKQVRSLHVIGRMLGHRDWDGLMWITRIQNGWRRGQPIPHRKVMNEMIVTNQLTTKSLLVLFDDLRSTEGPSVTLKEKSRIRHKRWQAQRDTTE